MSRESMDGVRIHVILTKPQHAAMRKYGAQCGLSLSELFRRAVDGFLLSAQKQVRK